MGLFSRDPHAKAVRERARWLDGMALEMRGEAQNVLSELPELWIPGRIDRESFLTNVRTYGVPAVGPTGEQRCGVALTKIDALRTLTRRLRGELDTQPTWAPAWAHNAMASELGARNVEDLAGAGWTVSRPNNERYGPVATIGVGALHPDGREIIAIAAGREERLAFAAMTALLTGHLHPTETWAPA